MKTQTKISVFFLAFLLLCVPIVTVGNVISSEQIEWLFAVTTELQGRLKGPMIIVIEVAAVSVTITVPRRLTIISLTISVALGVIHKMNISNIYQLTIPMIAVVAIAGSRSSLLRTALVQKIRRKDVSSLIAMISSLILRPLSGG